MKMLQPIVNIGLLLEYDISIQHHPGRVHCNIDVLSRWPCERNRE